VSRLGGFTSPFSGSCFPQLGPQLFVVMGVAANSRSRSSRILMGWWSAQFACHNSGSSQLTKKGLLSSIESAFWWCAMVVVVLVLPRSAFRISLETGRQHETAGKCRVCVASSMYCCGGIKEPKGLDGEGAAAAFAHAVAPVGAPSAAAVELHGEWRGRSKSCCCVEQRRFRKDEVTQRDSVARFATFDKWRLAAEQGSRLAWSATTDIKVVFD